MNKELIKLANALDESGFKKEADRVDALIKISYKMNPQDAKRLKTFLQGARAANAATGVKNIAPIGIGITVLTFVGVEAGMYYLEEVITDDEYEDLGTTRKAEVQAATEAVEYIKNEGPIDPYSDTRGPSGQHSEEAALAALLPGVTLSSNESRPPPGTRDGRTYDKGYADGERAYQSTGLLEPAPNINVPNEFGDPRNESIYLDGFYAGWGDERARGIVIQFRARVESNSGSNTEISEEPDGNNCSKEVVVACIALRVNEQKKSQEEIDKEEIEELLMDMVRVEEGQAGAPQGSDSIVDSVREQKRLLDKRLYGPEVWGYLYFDITDKDGTSVKKAVDDICEYLPLGGFNHEMYGIQSYLAAEVHANRILGIPRGRHVPGEALPTLTDIIHMDHNSGPDLAIIDLKTWACENYPDAGTLILKDHTTGNSVYCGDGESPEKNPDNPGGYIDLIYTESVLGQANQLGCPDCD